MTEPAPRAWWEDMGRWGMTGAGAGIGLFLALLVLVIGWLSAPAAGPVAASGAGTPKNRGTEPLAVESASGPSIAVLPLAPAPQPLEVTTEPSGAPPSEQAQLLASRQAIYRELHRVGMQALRDADRQFPLNAIPEGRDDLAEKYLLGHQAAVRLNRRAGRLALTQKLGLAAGDLDAIQRQGNEQRWPVGAE